MNLSIFIKLCIHFKVKKGEKKSIKKYEKGAFFFSVEEIGISVSDLLEKVSIIHPVHDPFLSLYRSLGVKLCDTLPPSEFPECTILDTCLCL